MAVDLLQRDADRRECLEHLGDALVDPGEPLAHGLACRARPDHARLDHEGPARRRLDHRIAGHVQARVDPHDPTHRIADCGFQIAGFAH